MSSSKQFQMKLLSGNNVVLVDVSGYESEIFMPFILNGRITFQNIIPNRRCCQAAQACGASKLYRKPGLLKSVNSQEVSACDRRTLTSNPSKAWRMSAGQEITSVRLPPLAFSTPISASAEKENSRHSNIFERRGTLSQSSSTLPLPEQPRHSVASPYEVVKNMLVQIPTGVKVIRLYRKPNDGTPKRVDPVVSTRSTVTSNNANSTCNSPTPQTNTSAFQLPVTPELVNSSSPKNSITRPTQSSLQKQVIRKGGSISRWRKCITPIRTYTRRTSTAIHRCNTGHSGKRSVQQEKVKPNYLANPTQGAKATHHLEVRRRKLIVDTKVAISPHTFKEQQTTRNDNKTHLTKFHLPKDEKNRTAAFDLLTNSNRAHCLSAKLTQQFRNGCINKASSTNTKYKRLYTLPPLENDEQMKDLSKFWQEQIPVDPVVEKRKGSMSGGPSEGPA